MFGFVFQILIVLTHLEFWKFERFEMWTFETLQSWNFENLYRGMMKNPIKTSSTSWMLISYLSKTWNGKLVIFLFSSEGLPAPLNNLEVAPSSQRANVAPTVLYPPASYVPSPLVLPPPVSVCPTEMSSVQEYTKHDIWRLTKTSTAWIKTFYHVGHPSGATFANTITIFASAPFRVLFHVQGRKTSSSYVTIQPATKTSQPSNRAAKQPAS